MLMPKKTKYRKHFRGKRRGKATKGNKVSFGDFGIQSLDNAWIDSKQIEAARIAISRILRGEGKMWIRVFPDKVATSKPIEVRMGKGKGEPEKWVAVIRRGRILYEMEGISEEKAKRAHRLANAKFPIKTRLITRK
jgi:large subunit ribosomal protein L16